MGKGEKREKGKEEGEVTWILAYMLTMNNCDFSLLLQTSHISLVPRPPPILIAFVQVQVYTDFTKSSAHKGLNDESMHYAASV